MKINKNLMSINHTPCKRSKNDIKFIVIHYVGALGDAKANTDYYKNTQIDASADYWVGFSGDIWQGNDYWNYYSWAIGGGLQGNKPLYYQIALNSNSINIEMCVRKRNTQTMNATDKDWYFEDTTIESTAELTAQLMKEADVDITHVIRHYDVNGKICPNPFVYDTGKVTWNHFKKKVTDYYNNGSVASPIKGTLPSSFSGLSESQAAAKILELAQADYQKSGLLPSITAAQMILESGYVKTELSLKASNCFGMKAVLSGNSWPGSTWDGKSTYTKMTKEEYTPGVITEISAAFRKYPNIESSISDHSAYLLGAKNGNSLRYPGLKDTTDYKLAANIIKNGGYATDSQYVSKLCSIIGRFELDKPHSVLPLPPSLPLSPPSAPPSTDDSPYSVGTLVTCSSYYPNASSPLSKAIISSLKGTITKINKNKPNPYQINQKYWCNKGDIRSYVLDNITFLSEPYLLKVTASDLNIRTKPDKSSLSKGFTGSGIFTIIAESTDNKGQLWGLLKSYSQKKNGWIALLTSCTQQTGK